MSGKVTKPKEEKDASKGKPARRVRLLPFPWFPSPRLACAPPFSGSRPPSGSLSCPWPLRPRAKKGETAVAVGEGSRFPPLSLLPRGIVAPRVPPASSTPPLDAPWWRCGQPKLLQPGALGTALPATHRPPACVSACVCVCASVHICAARVKHGYILRNLPHSQNLSSDPPSTPSPRPQCKQRAWWRRKTPPPRSFPPHTPYSLTLYPSSPEGRSLQPSTRGVQKWAIAMPRRRPRCASAAQPRHKPRENKGCCPFATSAQRKWASTGGGESTLPPLSGV